jgi:hypothetical protein
MPAARPPGGSFTAPDTPVLLPAVEVTGDSVAAYGAVTAMA